MKGHLGRGPVPPPLPHRQNHRPRATTLGAAVALGVLGLAGCRAEPTEIEARRQAIGEPTDGFPDWAERVIHVWANRARCDPAADLADCSVCAEKDCYEPVPPLVWSHGHARAARFHSANLALAGCSLQHDSPCDLVATIGSDYVPGPCDGDPDCACEPDTLSCGSAVTIIWDRFEAFGIPRFGAENIARASWDPVAIHYMWLHEPDSNPACGWRMANGHRANILGGSGQIGVGRYGSTYTQDFAGGGSPSGLVSGVHHPQTGSDIEFRANWYSGSAPAQAMVNLDGTCHPMSLERGTGQNGTYLGTVSGLGAGCHRYYFQFDDGSGEVAYPTTGAYGIGCATDWEPSRAPFCGCDPDCAGRVCGDDGCGGSCGSCEATRRCTVAGQCVCRAAYTECAGACVNTTNDPDNCGGCGIPCASNEECVDSSCVCVPDCAGKECGDDGCGDTCGSCAADWRCDAASQCVCNPGLTECTGSCVDTDTDTSNCGDCDVPCDAGDVCVDGTCETPCYPDCTGRECGTDGCTGSCGTCPPDRSCDGSGQCACASGLDECTGVCVDQLTDEDNCGSCGNPCAVDEHCVGGSCQSTCVADCTGRVCGDDGCGGSCGTCGPARTCNAAGDCVCASGWTDCSGVCVDTENDPGNCGLCGRECDDGETCVDGACECTPSCDGRECGADGCGGACGLCADDRLCSGGACLCDASLTECVDECVDVRIDEAHCGGCEAPCDEGESCVVGTCSLDAPDGGCLPACDGRSCGDDACGGSCGDCAADQICASGGQCLCAEELTACEGLCVDTRVDEDHCGGCDSPCRDDQRCVGGECVGGEPEPDGGVGDGGPDGGLPDGGLPDGGLPDGGLPDGGRSNLDGPGMSGGWSWPSCECSAAAPGRGESPPWLPLVVGVAAAAAVLRRRFRRP